jgi:hypothetical protein
MAMAGGIVSGLFDPTTFSSSSPTAADQQSPAAFKRSEGFFSLVPETRLLGGDVFFLVPESCFCSQPGFLFDPSLEPLLSPFPSHAP